MGVEHGTGVKALNAAPCMDRRGQCLAHTQTHTGSRVPSIVFLSGFLRVARREQLASGSTPVFGVHTKAGAFL